MTAQMKSQAEQVTDGFAQLLPSEHDRLVRLCAHLTNDLCAAEDLAQETLLIAWRKRDQLFDLTGVSYWLTAIARNVCRGWVRAQYTQAEPIVDELPDLAADIEIELERDEIALLLDRALALLTPDARSLLIQHYINEQPGAELAARLGVSENALNVRLHRGKLSLRRALATHFPVEAAAYGLLDADDGFWQETRMWCNYCGQHHMLGQWDREHSTMRLSCPGCGLLMESTGPLTQQFKTFKPCYTNVLAFTHDRFRQNDGTVTCFYCNKPLRVQYGKPPHLPGYDATLYTFCPDCGKGAGTESWESLTLSLPEVGEFWRDHPRMRALPRREIDADGSPAVVTGYASLTDVARIEVVTTKDTLRVLRVS
jgi:RNA polymerase sigma-70 factor (ECF subfamily)